MHESSSEWLGITFVLMVRVGEELYVLLSERDEHAHRYPDTWVIPGEGRENGESPEEATERGVREEFGLDVDAARMQWIVTYEHDQGDITLVYLLEVPETALEEAQALEERRLRWCTLSEIDALVTERKLGFEQDRIWPHIRQYIHTRIGLVVERT